MTVFLLQISAMLAMGLLFGEAARRMRWPSLFGELLAGVVLGPTLFARVLPDLRAQLFPGASEIRAASSALIGVGMLLFLFIAGLEVDLEHVRERWGRVAWTSLLGMAVPMAAGVAWVMAEPRFWGAQAEANPGLFALFVGTVLSISALPVIARVLMDLGLLRHDLGIVTMTAATLDDVVGWSLFAVVLDRFAAGGRGGVLDALGSLAALGGFAAAILVLGRWGGGAALAWMRRHLTWPSGFLAASAAGVLAASAAAEALGFHAVFGAFFVGVALARHRREAEAAHETIRRFVLGFFAPLYFVSVGMSADFSGNLDPWLVIPLVGVACAAKIGGVWLGARLGGMPRSEALAVAFGMNARGAMAVILASVAVEARFIDDRVFVAIVLMAVVTSMLSGPALQSLTGRSSRRGEATRG